MYSKKRMLNEKSHSIKLIEWNEKKEKCEGLRMVTGKNKVKI